jgi:hypothetical protein
MRRWWGLAHPRGRYPWVRWAGGVALAALAATGTWRVTRTDAWKASAGLSPTPATLTVTRSGQVAKAPNQVQAVLGTGAGAQRRPGDVAG